MKATVTDVRTLKALAKAGYIELMPETGCMVGTPFGGKIKAVYIDSYKSTSFTHKGRKFEIEYFDGCFCPFVQEVFAIKLETNEYDHFIFTNEVTGFSKVFAGWTIQNNRRNEGLWQFLKLQKEA